MENKSDAEVLEAVQSILSFLEAPKWVEIPESTLIASQGKLSVYTAYLGAILGRAIMAHQLKEQAMKIKEADLYLEFRREGTTDNEAKMNARVGISFLWSEMIEAKKALSDIKSVYDAVVSTITAIQVTLRALNREADTAKFQNR
jgi:hypothetical protein